jgi:5-methylcytosine-specific restriction endonuclease McrA
MPPLFKAHSCATIKEGSARMRTLVLDSTYFPVKIISWQRAIVLVLTGRAEVVLEDQDQVIRSVNHHFKFPKILRLFNRHLQSRGPKFSRQNIFLRDDYTCQYCAQNLPASKLTLDHVKPLSRGGPMTWENIVTSCAPCNGRKGNRTPEEARMALLKVPRPPRWSPLICLRLKETDPQEWFDWFPRLERA